MPDQVNSVIFYPHSDLFSNPSLLLIVKGLLDRGGKVILATEYYPTLLPPGFESLIIMRLPAGYPRPRRPLLYLRNYLLPLIRLRVRIKKLKVGNYLAVDMKGLLSFHSVAGTVKARLHYISFEILSEDELPDAHNKRMKKMEIGLLQKGISSLLIQDSYRMRLFNDANPANKISETFFLPVAPAIRYERPMPVQAHKPARVIYSGSLWPWSGIEDILKNLPVNNQYRLTVHHRFPEWTKDRTILYIQSLIADGHALELQNKGYEPDAYFDYLKDFDIGLVTYKPDASTGIYNGKNLENIGYSSGKFSTFMALGIPVVVTASDSYNDLIKKYGFGYIIHDFLEIPAAIEYIISNYSYCSAEARRLYNEVLDPERYIHTYLNHLLSDEEKN